MALAFYKMVKIQEGNSPRIYHVKLNAYISSDSNNYIAGNSFISY